MMGFPIMTCADLLPFFVALETPLTVANIVDAKVKNPIVNTIAKIIQLFPVAFIAVVKIFEKVEHTIQCFVLPPYPWYGSKAELLEWEKIRNSMFWRAPYAQFWGNVVAYSAGAFILALPLLFKLSQVMAKRFHWEETSKLLNASAEKTIMTIVKVANIGFLVLALVVACAEVYPLGIAMCGLLLTVNLWSTVSYHWKPLPSPQGSFQRL